MIFALIPAAGKSSRMGRPKLSLRLGDRTVLERVLDALKTAGIKRRLVVVGPHVQELVPLATRAGAAVCLLPEETADMRATVERGLDWIAAEWRPCGGDRWLLVPADHPTLDVKVIRTLFEARKSETRCSVLVPVFAGKRGHPVLIDWSHVASMRAHPAGQGFDSYLRHCREVTREVQVISAEVLADLDTPEDYARMQLRSEP